MMKRRAAWKVRHPEEDGELSAPTVVFVGDELVRVVTCCLALDEGAGGESRNIQQVAQRAQDPPNEGLHVSSQETQEGTNNGR